MKKILLFALITITMSASCNLTKESKAEALVKESLKKALYKPDTYKPIETKVDSAFAPYDDPALFKELEKLEELNTEHEGLQIQIKHSKSSMAIWSDPYSAYAKNEYKEAKADYDEANEKMEKLMSKGKKQYNKVSTMLHTRPKFIGFKVIHNYRADNNIGNTLIGNAIFFIDKDFKEVIYSMELDEYNQIQKTIEQYIEQIEGEY